MSNKFVVEGGLSIPTGKKLELQGTDLDASATELNYLSTFGITGIADEDAMGSNSATKLASQQSIKAYVDAQLTASDLDITVDGGSAFAIDLDSETLEFTSGDGMDVTTTGSAITFTVETASATNPGMVELATNDETNTGTDAARAVTPAGLTAWTGDTALVTLGTIGTGTWQGTAVAGTYIAAEAIDSDHYTDGSIDNAHLAANSVDSDNYVDGSIDLIHMSANSVDSDQYVDGSIDNAHLAANSVDSDNYVDGSIDNAHLANDAVGADELASDAVVNASIDAAAAIDMDKLDGGSLANALTDLADGDLMYAGDIDASNALKSITFGNLEDAIFGNVSGDIAIAAGGAVTIQANSVALATDTTGDYVADVTAGTGLTSTGATTGENISHSLSVDVSQSQITTLAGATSIGTSGAMTTFAGTVNVDEAVTFDTTLGVTGVATIGDGSLLASSAAPSTDAMIANKKYVDDQVTGSDLDVVVGASSYDLDLTTEELGFAGTTNEIEVAFAESNAGQSDNVGTLTIGLPNDITIAGVTTHGGNVVSDTDSTDDLGTTAVRWANLFVDAMTLTDNATIGGTLGVTGVGTFTAQSVHSGGIQSGGNIVSDTDSTDDLGTSSNRWAELHVDAISGGSDEMIISADGDESSVSGGANDTLSLNASGGIFTDDAVDMDSTLNVEGLVTMQAAATVGTTLGVTGIGTFTAQSVHTAGLQSGGNIVSDTDSTDDLGTSAVRWANLYADDITTTSSGSFGTTLAVTGIGTFTAQSVHTGGLESGGNIVSDTDSTDDLGTSSKRWANVHHDASVMEYAKKSSFTKTMTGAADVAFTFDTADYKAVKILCRMADGTDYTAKEVLVASDTDSGSLVEYGTVSTSTERACDFSVTYAAGTCSVKCTGTASDVLQGTYELIA